VVRIALLPLTLKSFKSMQAMGRLQPEIKAMQAKYKGDKERLNQEMMKFYRENKVNPLASCLPIVAQLPVFLALFYMLRTDLRVTSARDQPARDAGSEAVRRRRRLVVPVHPDLDRTRPRAWSSSR
jgi:YidC/Oxa1 family membrane protein insertase